MMWRSVKARGQLYLYLMWQYTAILIYYNRNSVNKTYF